MGNGAVAKIKRVYEAVYEFLTEKWIETQEEGQISRLQRFAHFWLLVYKSFSKNRCPLRATALAYTTLLALVPLLAVAVSVTTSLLQERGEQATRKMIKQFVETTVPQLELVPKETAKTGNVEQDVVDKITQFISKVNTRTLGATGILGLILVGILLLSTIEDTFNDIWGVVRGRSWLRRIVQYWTTITLGPIVLALLIAHLGSAFLGAGHKASGTFAFIVQLLPSFLLISLAFALLYKLMPNTPVHWLAALIGGVMGGSLWLMLNIFNAFNLSKVIMMSKIYGPVAIIPIFLVGLYFSWLIVLFGAQVAYSFQNREAYVQAKKAETVNQRSREYLALRVMGFLGQRFERGEGPASVLRMSHELGVPTRLIILVLQPLLESGLVLEVASERDPTYTPGRPLETITCYDVLLTLRGTQQELETRDETLRLPVCAEFQRIQESEREEAEAVTLKELVEIVDQTQPASAKLKGES